MAHEAPKSAKHSLVHNLIIATPCPTDWHEMEGNDCVRFCGHCKLNVYNVSEMSLMEAEKLIIDKEGKVCLRLYRRHDGTVITKDCPVGLAAKMKSLARRSAAAIAALCSVVAAFMTLNDGCRRPNVSISKQFKMKYEENEIRTRERPSIFAAPITNSSADEQRQNDTTKTSEVRPDPSEKSKPAIEMPYSTVGSIALEMESEQWSGNQKTVVEVPREPSGQTVAPKAGYVTEYKY